MARVRCKSVIYHKGRYFNPGDEIDLPDEAVVPLSQVVELVKPKPGPKPKADQKD